MYEQHFGLSISPFATSPDPRFLFFTPSHKEALAGLMYGILNRKGFISLIGEAGTGKTSLLRRVLDAVSGNKSMVVNPSVEASDFTKLVMANFGIDPIPSNRVDQFIRFEKFLKQSREEGKLSILVVDEAQRLSPGVLEEIRMLMNFELPEGKLLQIILAGQSELRGILNKPDLWQLKQRIAMRLNLKPLSGFEEVGAYVRHRWVTAGGSDTAPFSGEAIRIVTQYSTGVPRIVNVLCDNALMLAFAEGAQVVAAAHVKAAAGELDLPERSRPLASNGAAKTNGFHPAQPPPLEPNIALTSNGGPVGAVVCPKVERVGPAAVRRSGFWGWFVR